MQKIIFNITLVCFLFCISCNKKSTSKWTVYNPNITGLSSSNERFEEMICKNDTLYLFGSLNSFSDLKKSKGLIYRSYNYGKSWDKIVEDNNESVFINSFDDLNYTYIISEKYKNNSFKNVRSNLLQFDKKFNKKMIMTFNDSINIHDGGINKMGFGYLLLNNNNVSNDNSIILTNNNFKSLNKIDFPFPIIKSITVNDKIYILSSDWKTNLNNVFFVVNSRGQIKKIATDYNCFDFCIQKGEILCVGEKENVNYLFSLHEIKKAKILFRFNCKSTPQKIYNYNNFISILFQTFDFTEVNYFFMNSFDNGENFNLEEIPISDYVETIFYNKDKSILLYSGGGRISSCRLGN